MNKISAGILSDLSELAAPDVGYIATQLMIEALYKCEQRNLEAAGFHWDVLKVGVLATLRVRGFE